MKLARLLYLTFLCLFYSILWSHSSSLAGDITSVELKMWKDYTLQEKAFLRERWDAGGVDSVVEVLKDWDKIRPDRLWVASAWWITRKRNLFPQLERPSYAPESDKVCPLFTALAGNFTIVPVKEWKEYTKAEKKVLRVRWTSEKIKAVVDALTGMHIGFPVVRMPGFVARLNSASESSFDLRGIQIRDLVVGGLDLDSIYLQGANLRTMTWQGTKLRWAKLQGADLREAWFKKAHLVGAELQGADLTEAQLQDVDLPSANLKGANLQRVNLQDANLYTARFDSTYLWQVNLVTARNIRYIIWGDSLKSRYFIGEEIIADSTKIYEDFRKAEITYRDLKTLYKRELMDDVAMGFHYRENEVKTKASP